MARSSPGGQSSSRIAAFFREPARMRPKTFPCYQNASPAPYNTYRVSPCFLATTLFVFQFLPRPTTPGADASAHKNVRSVAPNAPASDGEPLRQQHSSKGSRPKATAFAFLRLDKIPEACTVTRVRVFARRGGAAGVEAKCLHDFVQAFATVALQRKRCGIFVRSRRETGVATSGDALFAAKQNPARERSLRDEKEKYVTSVRVFARRGGAAGVEAKCLHDFVQAFATVALRRRWCAGRDLNPHERTAH